MTELGGPVDSVSGETLLAWDRKVSRIHLISGSSAHHAQSVSVWGMPARCMVDKAWRIKR
jgi:hypothetical protein